MPNHLPRGTTSCLGITLVAFLLLSGLVACGDSAAVPTVASTAAPSSTVASTATPPITATPTTTPGATSTPTVAPTPTATIVPSPSLTPVPPSASPTLTPRPSPTATRPAASPTPAALRPLAPIPTGWKSYGGGTPPLAVAYPPDWSAEEDQETVTFSHPNGTTGVLISALRHPGGTPSLRELRDAYFNAVTTECENAQQSGDGELVYGGVLFSTTGTECRLADQRLWFFIAVGIQDQTVRAIVTVETTERLLVTVDTYFEPMLATLNFGGQAQAPVSPSPSPRPSPTSPATTATPAALQPRAPVPAGWQAYIGSTVPFAIAYPPDWRADTTTAGQGYVNFVAPDGITTVQIRLAGDLTASLGIDRLRDLYMEELGKQCGAEARPAGYNTFAGTRFAALRIDCTAGGNTVDLYYGTGIKDGQEWTVSLIAPLGEWEATVDQFFGPIIDTLEIAGVP